MIKMVRWVAIFLLIAAVSADFSRAQRDKRQVTYHAEEHHEIDEGDDNESIRPVTKKPLPTQLVYPGDLSSFYTTDSPRDSTNKSSLDRETSNKSDQGSIRQKRSSYGSRINRDNKNNMRTPLRPGKQPGNKDNLALESRLHSSYHKPSVSIMNDVSVEMSFDGAGFLRHEDEDSVDEKKSDYPKRRNSGTRSPKTNPGNSKALSDFQKVFNISRERQPNKIKYDDETSYRSETPPFQATPEKAMDYGTQGAENGTPLSVDFMAAYQNAFQNHPYQNGMFGNPQFNYPPAHLTQTPQAQSYDPFSFTYPSNAFSGQSNSNQMMMPQVQQDSFMQNHRMPQTPNTGSVTPQTMYTPVPQQAFPANSMFTSSVNPPQNHKPQRRKRSISDLKDSGIDILSSASQVSQDRYKYSRHEDQKESSSGFIPITGTFNGGSIQLNFPFYGQSPPSYSHRPPVHSVPAYSMPMSPESRHYSGSVEHFYHPSEARRYSYGILGSGNFEVIRGGVFPGQNQQSYHNEYQDGRTPYGGNDYGGNYGTTEIIIDGPIQGFQGFDNFPVHLINALSKHSEIAIRPDRRNKDSLSE